MLLGIRVLLKQKGDWTPALNTILFMGCIGYANDYRAHLRKALPIHTPVRCQTPRDHIAWHDARGQFVRVLLLVDVL